MFVVNDFVGFIFLWCYVVNCIFKLNNVFVEWLCVEWVVGLESKGLKCVFFIGMVVVEVFFVFVKDFFCVDSLSF